MQRTKPPFRADHVGSFLRPPALKEARAKHESGAIGDAELKKVEDRAVEGVIKKQEEIGLKLASDGEFRRSWWHFDFFGLLDGVEIYELDHGIQFQGVQTKPRSIRVNGKIGFSNHPMVEHFRFLKAHTKVVPKMTIPSPTVMHFRLEPGAVAKSAYPSRDALLLHRRELGEVLIGAGYMSEDRLSRARSEMPSGIELGDYLLASGLISDDNLCKAISLQSGVPAAHVDAGRVKPRVARTLPAHVEKRFGIVPFRVEDGRLLVAGASVPEATTLEELKSFTRLPIEFQLVTRRNYQELRELL